MKYKVKFSYCFETEVETSNPSPSEIFKAADSLFPDSFTDPERFCNEIEYDGWKYEEVGA